MKKIAALLLVLFASIGVWAQTPIVVSKQTKVIDGKKYYAHVVEKGQTVFSIARAYGVNYHDAVYKSDIDKIAIGDTVFLPTNEKPEPVKFRYYVVKQGNTLYSLSKDFQVEIDDILRLNPKIENNNIKVGEVLKIPTERTLKEKSTTQATNTAEKQTTAPTYPADNTSAPAKSQAVSAGQKHNETQEKEAFERQQKTAQAMAKKEQERQQKELEEQQAKQKKELEKQQKELRQKAEKEAKAKTEQQEKELKAREKAEKEARQKAEKEAKAKAEQQEKELKAKEKAEKEARQKAEKEAKAKAEQQEKELKAKEKAEKEAREKAEKEALDKQFKERKELDNQKKELERERKEVEKQQKELEKQRKELEKQQKELEKQQKETASHQTNPKAEYHPINRPTPSPEVASTGRGNTAQQSDYTYTPPQPAKQEEQPAAKPQPQPATQPAATPKSEPAAQPAPAKPQPAPSPTPKTTTTTPSTSAYPELPLQTAPNIGSSVPAPNVVIRDRVSNTSINITLMMPLSLANIDEISTSKFDIEQRKRRKYKSFEFIQFYEGIMLGLESLKNEGVNVVLNVVDIPGDLPDRVAQAFATQNVAQSDFIIALVEKNAFEKAAQLAMENNVFILNPLSTRPEILDNNPYVVKLYPSYQGIVSSILSMLAKNYTSPNLFLVHSNAKLEKRLFDEFQQQLSAQNKIKYTIFDWSANAKLVNMLKNTAGDNIVVNIYDQTKDKNKTQSNLMLNRLFSIKKNTPTLITLPNWASRYEDDIDFAQLQRLNYHFCSNFFLDKSNPKHKDFVTRFKEKYKTEPQGNLAALGNDIIIHFVSGIKAKGTAKFWQDPNTDRRQSMIYHFHFKRSAPEKGFENQNAYFYKLNAKYQFQPAN